MNKITLFIIVGLFFMGCKDMASVKKNELLETDIAFSKLSETKGMNLAFMQYLADDGVLLKPNKMPIVGKDLIQSLFKGDDSKFTLTWTPVYVDIAESGELGYTYGTYNFSADGATESGTYVSIWKKNKNGEWKYVLDSGNEGLGD